MDKKSEQLGMPFGTANGRLHTKIMFMLVKQCGRDTCFRCGKKIERAEDLSVEHVRDWQDIDPGLFWDLANVSFSHRSCNYRHAATGRIPGNALYDKAPPGTAWCTKHKDYLPVENFQKDRNSKNGLERWCRECCRNSGFKGSYGR
jgi:hypothetical protein